jgi:hypothetical protein
MRRHSRKVGIGDRTHRLSRSEVLAQVPGVLGTGDEFEQPVVRLGAAGVQRLGGGKAHGQDVGEDRVDEFLLGGEAPAERGFADACLAGDGGHGDAESFGCVEAAGGGQDAAAVAFGVGAQSRAGPARRLVGRWRGHAPALPNWNGRSVSAVRGERLYSRWDFRSVLSDGIAVAQPDISDAGGISESRRIAAMAETYDVLVAPHCPLGPIALAASLQLDFAIPNFLIQEQALGIGYGDSSGLLDYLADSTPFTFRDGYIDRPTAPGLGITIDEDAVRAAAERGHRWRNPVWRNADGSLTSW